MRGRDYQVSRLRLKIRVFFPSGWGDMDQGTRIKESGLWIRVGGLRYRDEGPGIWVD